MNAHSKKPTAAAATVEDALNDLRPQLAKLREPFPPNQISKLPKESKAQREERQADRSKAVNCDVCGGWHHKRAVHLDYVGHAAATDRLLDTDIEWNWEPLAVDARGLPAFDENGGLWIKLTVCGVTRIGYGSADGKSGGDAKKEIIGDAIRNAGMRFGMALDLWHKGQLHVDDDAQERAPKHDIAQDGTFISEAQREELAKLADDAGVTLKQICDRYGIDALPQLHADTFEGAMEALRKTLAKKKAAAKEPVDILDDSIPY